MIRCNSVFEIIAEGEIRRSYLVLGPSESVNLNLKSMMPDRKGAVCMKVLRGASVPDARSPLPSSASAGMCSGKTASSIIHGSHQFFKIRTKFSRSA